jgi:CRISPR/Cas system CSM-associated protein Csm3 (group 7 of RAMP superfamily)
VEDLHPGLESGHPAGRRRVMGRRDYGPRVPKPYDFVEIEPLDPGDRQHPAGHERYHPGTVSGRLEATLIVATPLHVSSGRFKMRKGKQPPLVKGMTRVNGQPCVPASTLKGVVRSVVEAVTRSCVRIGYARMDNLPRGAAPCRDKDNLCLACRMFGALGFEGHVRFSDAVLHTGNVSIARMPAMYAPRKRGRVYFTTSDVKGRKFYRHGQTVTQANTPVEILMPNSQLKFTIRFENLKPGEIGVLLTALGLGEPQLVLKLGGGKPACYGSAIVSLGDLQVWENAQDLYAGYDVERVGQSRDEYVKEASGLLLSEQLRRLAEIWEYDMGRECPEGNY